MAAPLKPVIQEVNIGGVTNGPTTIYEVRVPNPDFQGVRNGIIFVGGKAQLAEPRVEDFDDKAQWQAELEVCHEILRYFAIELKYNLQRREVTLGEASPVDLSLLLTATLEDRLHLKEEL